MNRLVFLLFFFAASNGLFGQNKTSLEVVFPNSVGQKAFLWTYEDLMTYREILIDSTTINRSNSFRFDLKLKEVTSVSLQVAFFRIDFYIEPGKSYSLNIDSVDFSNRDFYPKNIVGYLTPNHKLTALGSYDLNNELATVNEFMAEFFDSNYVFLYQSKLPESVLNVFLKKMDSLKTAVKSDFTRNHIDFQLAQLELMTRKIGYSMVIEKYFQPSKVMYKNKVYMDFFNSFWSKYLFVSVKGLRYGQLDSAVNSGSYNTIIRLLEKDPFLQNAQIREMVVLRNIIQMYSSYRFSKEALNDILSDITNKGAILENRLIANNIRKYFLEENNRKAPDFRLPDFHGAIHELPNYTGKYVYLNFWNEECMDCVAEMDITKELFLDFDDIIQFISIYVGPNPDIARMLVEKREYKWLQLNYNQDFSLIKNYQLDMFPYYILINKEGNIEWYPSAAPSESFSEKFLKMLDDKKKNLE
ncbi:MAG: TlpA family protein disulfide reductase [Bacteroidales bacterium]|nr:TlpA family protein disulfide reductase [Bacteroidales bacterium]